MGGLIAAAGARIIAKAARAHSTPVIVVSGVYKLSPEYPFEFESLIEYGDPGCIVNYDDGPLVDKLEVDNPVYDYVPPDLVDLYITNLGAHAPSYLYRIVADHYKTKTSISTSQSFSFESQALCLRTILVYIIDILVSLVRETSFLCLRDADSRHDSLDSLQRRACPVLCYSFWLVKGA